MLKSSKDISPGSKVALPVLTCRFASNLEKTPAAIKQLTLHLSSGYDALTETVDVTAGEIGLPD